MNSFRIVAAVAALFMTACATTAGGGSAVRTYDFGGYEVVTERAGCSINTAKIHSKGMAIPTYTYHTLTIGAGGATSAIYEVNCEPVFAGGSAMCTSNSMGMTTAAATAGLGCGGWDQFNMVRSN